MTDDQIVALRKQIAEIIALAIHDVPVDCRRDVMRGLIERAANAVIKGRPDVTVNDMRKLLVDDNGDGPIGGEIRAMIAAMPRAGGGQAGKA